jgi:hypothetical protein
MSDFAPRHKPEILPPTASKEAYSGYKDNLFDEVYKLSDPNDVDLEVNELLLLVLGHPEFSQIDRLREYASISHLTMYHLRQLMQPNIQPQVIQQAEVLHQAYAQVYTQSMVELAKLGEFKRLFQ